MQQREADKKREKTNVTWLSKRKDLAQSSVEVNKAIIIWESTAIKINNTYKLQKTSEGQFMQRAI